MANLHAFSVEDLEVMSREIRAMGSTSPTMADAAAEISAYLYDGLRDGRGERDCVMVRLFATQPFRSLPEHLQRVARQVADDMAPSTSCLVTLASNGSTELPPESLPEERVLPFTRSVFGGIPFMPTLLERVGVETEAALDPRRAVEIRLQHRTFNVYIGRQLADDEVLLPNELHRQVVRDRGIAAVVALAGVLPTGGLLMMMLQTCSDVPDAVGELLQPLAVAVKAALIPHSLAILAPR